MKTLMMIAFLFICYVPTGVILAITPYITRKTESFGVTIPEEEYSNPEIKAIRETYRNRSLISGGIITLLAVAFGFINTTDTFFLFAPMGIFVLIGIMFSFYLRGHRKMQVLKTSKNWMAEKSQLVVADTSFRNKKIMASPLWFILYGAVIVATAAIGFAMYDKLPARIPMHWNAAGEIDRWAYKSYRVILWAPFTQIFLTTIMMFSYWMIGKSRQAINAANPEKSSAQNEIFRYRWSVFIILTGLAIVVMFGGIHVFSYGIVNSPWLVSVFPLVVTAGIVIGALILSITTGQGGSRLYIKEEKVGARAENKIVSRDEDQYWKLGLFYFNPDDPAFIVEKRFGIGWTNNWARPISWVLTLGLAAVIIGFSLATRLLTK